MPRKKPEIVQASKEKADPSAIQPSTAADYLLRGMAYYARQQYGPAEADLRQAASQDPRLVDAWYCLGMVLKAAGRRAEAVAAFQKTLPLLELASVDDKVRSAMLHRLAVGHINALTQGDWNLEKEIWHRLD